MVEQSVKEIIADYLNIKADSIKTDARILWDLGADSLDVVEILLALEEKFDVSIKECEATEAGDTVGDLVSLVTKKLEQKQEQSS